MDATKAVQIRDAIKLALKPLETQFGVKFDTGRVTYNSRDCHFKLSANEPLNGVIEPVEARNYKLYCSRFGLPQDALNKTFKYNTKTYTVTGLKLKAHKKPVLITDQNGKVFVASADFVKRNLGI